MMKKILVLLLVLGMASWAHAGLINVVADGVGDMGHAGTALDPLAIGEVLKIKITLAAGASSDGYDLDLHVTGAGQLAESAGGINYAPGIGMWTYSGIVGNSIAQMSEIHLMGQWKDQDLIWNLEIECTGEDDVLVDLTLNGGTRVDPMGGTAYVDLGEADLGDLVIYQIPEPMTIALLGLGGLLALRRRK
jgi:hypothetical protein